MKKLFALIIAIIGCLGLSAQQIQVQLGRSHASFDYQNSLGEGLQNQRSENQFTYEVNYRHTLGKRFYPLGGLVFRRYAVSSTIPEFDMDLGWDTQYLGMQLGMDYAVVQKDGWRALLLGRGGPQWMIQGEQSVNEEVFDLTSVEQFDRSLWFYSLGAGFHYCMDDKIAVGASYFLGRGGPLGKSDDPESLNIVSQQVVIGITISLNNCSYCTFQNLNSTR